MKHAYKEARYISADQIRSLCFRMGWYTRGTCEAYDHLLTDLAEGKENLSTADIIEIAEDIAAHSDFSDVCPEDDVVSCIAFEVNRACTIDLFNHILVRGNNEGKKRGFPYFAGCSVNRDCKMKAINAYWKAQKEDVVQYVGIAVDEPSRLERLTEKKVSLLEKYGYTEEMARQLCEEYGLLSPIYQFSRRNGCWFCPNAGKSELRHLYFNHRNLVDLLIDLEKTENLQARGKQFSRNGTPSQVFEEFWLEGAQISLFDFLE